MFTTRLDFPSWTPRMDVVYESRDVGEYRVERTTPDGAAVMAERIVKSGDWMRLRRESERSLYKNLMARMNQQCIRLGRLPVR